MSGSFARLRGALDRVGTTTPGTIVGVFAEDLTAIMDHYVEVVREAAELKAARAQPAQAGQVLTDAEIDTAYEKARVDYQRSRFRVCGQQLTASDSFDWWFARAIEQAVRAKMGVAVPMTLKQIIHLTDEIPLHEGGGWFVDVVRAAEKFHGIVGKEGA